MFPNPQDALPLPTRPNLDQYRKLAKDLVKACKSHDRDAIHAWTTRWVEALVKLSGVKLTPHLPVRVERWVDQVAEFADTTLLRTEVAKCTLTGAQFVIARAHGFESWPKLAKHVEAAAQADSPVSRFELAADAIVSGDKAALKRLLREHPELIHARSTREHQATLLHYVSANGIEGYRQKTPRKDVEIARILLDAGAEVDATAQVYGGGATTLGLVATSVHPERFGVQEPLMELLLQRGAKIDPAEEISIVNICLANGRRCAAEFLAQRGARLDLEAAAGVGRLDVGKGFFNEDGSLKPNATKTQMERGFLWACGYGRNSVVEFLLHRGVDINTQANTGQTGLHWAVIGGAADTICLLLESGASLEMNNIHSATALGQALWSAVSNYYYVIDYTTVIEILLEDGAKIQEGTLAWLEQQRRFSPAMKARIAELLRQHGAKS